MRGKEADCSVKKSVNPQEASVVRAVVPQERHAPVEITDADYRSIFLPCEAMEEQKERPG